MTGPIKERPIGWNSAPQTRRTDEGTFDFTKLTRAVRRQLPLITICAGIGMMIAILMALGSIPRFRAIETILLDEERGELLNQVSALPHSVLTDSAVQSEMEIIKSRALAFRVVERLRLHENEDFLNPPVDGTRQVISSVTGVFNPIRSLLTSGAEVESTPDVEVDPQAAARDRAAAMLRNNLEVTRIGRSFVIEVVITDFDPARAAAIARAYGDAYMNFQLQSTTELATNAAAWISQRLRVLEQQSLEAESQVQEFRVANNLVQVRGNLLTEQQQSEIASELIRAAAETAQIRARLENFEALIAGPVGDVITVASLETGTGTEAIMAELRADYLSTRRRWTSVVQQFGEDHPQALTLQANMATLEASIGEEVGRAIAAIRASLAIAQSREDSLRNDLEMLSGAVGRDVATMGRLRQLEAISETFATVYRDYLRRFEVTTQQQGFPIASVQVISPAEEPTSPSSPRRKMMLVTGLMLGGLLGAGLGTLREIRPGLLRTGEDVANDCDLPCAGLVPRDVSLDAGTSEARVMARTLRRIRQEIDRQPDPVSGGRVIGLAAVERGGNSAALVPALCSILSEHGSRLLVVDAGGADEATTAAIKAREDINLCSLDYLAEEMRKEGSSPRSGLDRLRSAHDYILLLLPPLTRTVEADPLTGITDISVLTIPWGKISPTLLNGALRDHRDFRAKLATTVLDGADLKTARLYMRPGDYEERVVRA